MSPVSAATRVEIEDLLSEFAARVDEGRAATVHELFVEAARVETPLFVVTDREQIRERFTARAKDSSRKTRHYWTNPKFSGTGDEVTVVTNVMTVVGAAGRPTMVTGGSSTDIVVRRNGNWLFQSRRLDVVFEGTLAVPGETR